MTAEQESSRMLWKNNYLFPSEIGVRHLNTPAKDVKPLALQTSERCSIAQVLNECSRGVTSPCDSQSE